MTNTARGDTRPPILDRGVGRVVFCRDRPTPEWPAAPRAGSSVSEVR